MRFLLSGILIVACCHAEPLVPAIEQTKLEIIRKLQLHKEHVVTLQGGPEFDSYRTQVSENIDKICSYLRTNKLKFLPMKDSKGIMEVRKDVPDTIFVNLAFLSRFRQDSVYAQQVICHEVSHVLFWTQDLMNPANIVNVKLNRLTTVSDWYNFLIIYAEQQKALEPIYFGKG